MLNVFPESLGIHMDTPNSGMPGRLPADTLKIKHFDELNDYYSRLLL
jgi:hypothetical protein